MNCFKTSNISRHYETVHIKKKNPACELTGEQRKNKIQQLQKNLQVQTSMFATKGNERERSIKARYAISELLGTHMKPFAEGEFFEKTFRSSCISYDSR